MPVYRTFTLNNRETSTFTCSGFGAVAAYSGHGRGRDNPNDVADVGVGAIPPRTYYIIDRQSGGRLGWFRDTFGPWFGTTDRHTWFMLWNAHGGDITNINSIQRGNFRLHPDGPMHESDGCITVLHHMTSTGCNATSGHTSPTCRCQAVT
ncbi:DUF2778 domain-containing protein [Paraburkholderia franconis]|uniref:DUF2778 domain-containing protein n=1 Tax=Paraburkholderia franconis TaxID=2654983 RepID=UPI001D12CDE1|nr:DUF2778 domain-containing protein [Paraburkholderia franconis]